MRAYEVPFSRVNVSAVQDLIGIYTGASQAVELAGIVIGQLTTLTVAILPISIHRLTGGFTPGSGGTTFTPAPSESGDAASTISSAHCNDTTQATGGTSKLVHADDWNLVNGYQFFWPEKLRPQFGLSSACILSLDVAPSGTIVVSGTLYFVERV